ncbi:ATP synthase F1 subunit delta [Mesoaciditoga lauensis]|uniref:ATP synthase F1 subunit delta n=1 Tax=Mesoaciditoga lauensis TaxID=1495039 RepID=UPI0005688990|nr:ATP synthase F1 subunit delta [Mesoaciditoga lauensis]
MKTSHAVVLRYARALLELNSTQCLETMKTLANLKDEKVIRFLNDPTVLPSFKAELISASFKTDERCKRILEIIFEHKRFKMFKDLYEVSWKLWLRKTNKEEVKIRTAQELDKKEIEEIEKLVKKIRKTEPVIDVSKEEELLAGIVIDFEDSVVDMSAAGALKKAASLMYGG